MAKITYKTRSLGVTTIVMILEKEQIVNKFIETECFRVLRGNDNFTELELIGSGIFVRVEVERNMVKTSLLCLAPIRDKLAQSNADILDMLSNDLPDEIAEKIIFNLDVINELLGD